MRPWWYGLSVLLMMGCRPSQAVKPDLIEQPQDTALITLTNEHQGQVIDVYEPSRVEVLAQGVHLQLVAQTDDWLVDTLIHEGSLGVMLQYYGTYFDSKFVPPSLGALQIFGENNHFVSEQPVQFYSQDDFVVAGVSNRVTLGADSQYKVRCRHVAESQCNGITTGRIEGSDHYLEFADVKMENGRYKLELGFQVEIYLEEGGKQHRICAPAIMLTPEQAGDPTSTKGYATNPVFLDRRLSAGALDGTLPEDVRDGAALYYLYPNCP